MSKSCWIWGYQNFDSIPWKSDSKIFAQFLELRGWDSYAFVLFPKSSSMFNILPWSISYIRKGVFIGFHVNPRNFKPRNFQFLVSFWFKTIFAPSPRTTLVAHLFIYFKNLPHPIPYPNAHANAEKMIFDIQYPGNRFEFGIISNDFLLHNLRLWF